MNTRDQKNKDVLLLSERLRKEAASLGKRKGREAVRKFLIEGVRSVEAAVEAGAELVHVMVNERLVNEERLQALIESIRAPVYQMTDKQEKSITTVETSPGCMAVARYKGDTLEDVLSMQSVVVLDGLQDPGNVGTIIRTASWFGIDAVVLGAGSVDIFHPKTVRSTMGGLWGTCCVRVKDVSEALREMKSHGFSLQGTFMEGESVSDWQPQGKVCIVIGSESRGISEAVQMLIDKRISIPGNGEMESLNAATAASICMYVYASSIRKTSQKG